jgi:hypothetical protein
MPTITQLSSPTYLIERRQAKKHSDTVNYYGVNISPFNHPAAIANHILNVVQHKKVFGLQATGAMGEGKNTFVTAVIHHIHKKDQRYKIIWAGSYEFQHMESFLESLPKYQPVIIAFDDISGALKELSEKDLNHNFQALTKIRWIIDPEKGQTPAIIFTMGHYSRTTEKAWRAVLGLVALMSFNSEEQTNIDLLAPKNTFARLELLRFKKIADSMFSNHEFYLRIGTGEKILCKTDEPLRACCVLAGTNGYTIAYSQEDCCGVCSKKNTARYVEPAKIYDIIYNAHKAAGIQALKLAMYKRGKYLALGKNLAPALDFVESKVFPMFTTNLDGLVEEIYRRSNRKIPKRMHHNRKLEAETMKQLYDESIQIETNDPLSEDL